MERVVEIATGVYGDECVDFIVTIENPDDKYRMVFKVEEVNSWFSDRKPDMYDLRLYLKGEIKWDGCSHIWFGDEDRDGYIHLCGEAYWDQHCTLMKSLFTLAKSTISGWKEEGDK